MVIPLLLTHARTQSDQGLESRLHDLYSYAPPLPPNAVTRAMTALFFDSEAEARRSIASARMQQGLHQVYADYCGSSARGCEHCLVRLREIRARRKGALGL